jgi:protein tyrosine/serine phosphatase
MKKRKWSRTGLAIVVLTAAGLLLVRHFYIKDFCIIEPDVLYTSDQPRGMDYTRLLYNYHIATIVNVRPAPEHMEENWRSEEVVWTRSNAVHYVEMPIDRTSYFPNQQMQSQFLAVMADKDNLPVLIHGVGDDKRVAMLVAVWLRRSQGYSAERTVEAVKRIIDDRPLRQEELKFIQSLAQENSR